MNNNVDINSYFEYVEQIIEQEKRVANTDKEYYRKMISIFKVGSFTINKKNSIPKNIIYDEIDFEIELYNLFEILSKQFLKILNYHAWRKRVKFNIQLIY